MRFSHIGIKVLDVERSLSFYQSVLDAKLLGDHEYPESRLIFLEVCGTVLELIFKETNRERKMGSVEHIAFNVENLEFEMEKLDRKGIVYTEPRIVGHNKIIFFDGPDHERFEFVEKVL